MILPVTRFRFQVLIYLSRYSYICQDTSTKR